MTTTSQDAQESAKDSAANVDSEGVAKPRRGVLREYFESGVVTVIMALFFMTFVAQAAAVPSASMQNTIFVGDHFLINKFIFAPGPHTSLLPQRDIKRGDIVVFKYPAESIPKEKIYQYKTLFIKRVIGLPGETVEVRGHQVFIDGEPIPEFPIAAHDPKLGNDHAELKALKHARARGEEPYTVYYEPSSLSSARPARVGEVYAVGAPFRVPDGQYFVMGDNRDNSKDSRYWGPVPRELMVGRALFVIWSFDESLPKDEMPVVGRVIDFFRNTRWSRTGTLIR
ncbi:MAG TPA: signal peptidase I [Pyrinomonadaceae bacterium]|nr:signal peptidase I [Pyrinomonadaceae bacterium]